MTAYFIEFSPSILLLLWNWALSTSPVHKYQLVDSQCFVSIFWRILVFHETKFSGIWKQQGQLHKLIISNTEDQKISILGPDLFTISNLQGCPGTCSNSDTFLSIIFVFNLLYCRVGFPSLPNPPKTWQKEVSYCLIKQGIIPN